MDQPAPLALPTPITEPTCQFWNWIYNDVFGHDEGVRPHQFARWGECGIPELDRRGGLYYSWLCAASGQSTIRLWTDDDAHRQSRQAQTDNPRPPFSLLTDCWLGLCRDLELIDDDQWAAAVAGLDRFKTWEQATEYDQC